MRRDVNKSYRYLQPWGRGRLARAWPGCDPLIIKEYYTCMAIRCFYFLPYWMQLVISAKIPMRISAGGGCLLIWFYEAQAPVRQPWGRGRLARVGKDNVSAPSANRIR
jgi:hypothetical protein